MAGIPQQMVPTGQFIVWLWTEEPHDVLRWPVRFKALLQSCTESQGWEILEERLSKVKSQAYELGKKKTTQKAKQLQGNRSCKEKKILKKKKTQTIGKTKLQAKIRMLLMQNIQI